MHLRGDRTGLLNGDHAWKITARTFEHEYTIHIRTDDFEQLEKLVLDLVPPKAINDCHVFQTEIREVYFPEEIQRLFGLPFIVVPRLVLLSAPQTSPFVVGHEYGLLDRPELGCEVTFRDRQINHQRKAEFDELVRLGRWKPPVPSHDHATEFSSRWDGVR